MIQPVLSPVIETPDSLLAALDRGESLPAHWYTDAAITAREIEKIFRKSWNYIGPAKELTNLAPMLGVDPTPERVERAVRLSSASHMRSREKEQSKQWVTTM